MSVPKTVLFVAAAHGVVLCVAVVATIRLVWL